MEQSVMANPDENVVGYYSRRNNMNTQEKSYRKSRFLLLLAGGLVGSLIYVKQAYAAFGQCKDMEIKFINGTGDTITIPSEGHKVKNPGGIEGWNNMTLGGSINKLGAGKSKSVRQTLNIKCVDDAQFEIHYAGKGGRDFTQIFEKVNIEDKYATLTLTHN
jgi:hypothetical protein